MTIKDARKLIAVFMVTYPSYKPIDTELAAATWADAMSEYTYEQVSVALKMYLKTSTSGFAPTPGQLIEKIQVVTQPELLSETEAWAIVRSSLSRCGYYSVEEFEKFPPIIQKAVGSPSQLRVWALDQDYNEGVVSAQFGRVYRALAEKQKDFDKMPSNIQHRIEDVNKTSYSAQLQAENQKVIVCMVDGRKLEIGHNTDATDVSEMSGDIAKKLKNVKSGLRGA
jgi:hypothetical protein